MFRFIFNKRLIQPNRTSLPSLLTERLFFSTSLVSFRHRHFPTVTDTDRYEPASYKTLAFYQFYALDKKVELSSFRMKLLKDLGRWGVVGRIYIANEGINAQIACPQENLERLKEYHQTVLKPLFGGRLMDFNIGTEHGMRSFRALHVRIRKQLVADGLDPESYDLNNVPSHLKPEEWHQKLKEYERRHGKKPILIDMRNHYESRIGHFEGAICPDADTFKDSIQAMNDICQDVPRDEEIFMYCTGGIRCTKAGAILQSASGFKTVHLVEGGITAYGRWIQDQVSYESSLFKGKNFTFDARLGEKITEDVLGKCQLCGQPCNRYQNCAHSSCNILMLCCSSCSAQFLNTCSRFKCYDTVHDYLCQNKEYFDKAGPIVSQSGVRAFVKEGEKGVHKDRVVVGKAGESCDHEHNRRIRAIEVLGEPGEILKEWAKAGRALPPKVGCTE